MKRLRIVALGAAYMLVCHAGADLPKPENPRWAPQRDDVYLQEVGRQVQTAFPLFAAAVYNGVAYAGAGNGVLRLDGETLTPAGGPSEAIRRLEVLDGALWALGEQSLWRYDGKSWSKAAEGAFTDLCLFRGKVHAAQGNHVLMLDENGATPLRLEGVRGPILGIGEYAGALYLRHAGSIGVEDRGQADYENVADWGYLQRACKTRDMLPLGSRLFIATDQGLGLLRGMTWYPIRGEQGLCYEDTTCLAEGFEKDDFWVGTSRGAIRVLNGAYQYFGHTRWIPHDKVNAIACGGRAVYIATDGGLGIIEYEPYTLLKKAAWYERWLDEWGQKRLGFTHKLEWDAASQKWVREISDNDVGFSSHYLDALCFKYAVTKEPAVRDAAIFAFETIKWSEEITPIDGFPARSIWAVGEEGHQAQHGSGGLPAEWHLTEDGKWMWKGDTSSDETDAHFYSVSLFAELVAEGENRDKAIEHIRRLAGHIYEHGFILRDIDGKPTRWARWDPEYLQRPYGYYARGLNGMEAMSYMTTAYALTGDDRFKQAKQQLLDWGYHNETLRQKLVFPPGYFTHFDDRLAFYAYYPLLRYERDPELRSIFLRSLERSWEVKRAEGAAWFHFIYGAITGNDCENERAVQFLREAPLDCVKYVYRNSHRHDLHLPPGYVAYNNRDKILSPRETNTMNWDADYMALDGGSGLEVNDPSPWLDAYWMGRYYGFIEAPTVNDPALTNVEPRGLNRGAAPYNGPPRPEIGRAKKSAQ